MNTKIYRLKLYILHDCDSRFSELQKFIHIETNIPVLSQLILYEECFLKDIIKDDMPLSTYPKTSQTSPYILIRTNDVSQCTMPEERNFWYYTILLGKLGLKQMQVTVSSEILMSPLFSDCSISEQA